MELTEEILGRLCAYIRLGADVETAAMAAGVAPSVLASWVQRSAENDQGIYADLMQRLAQARAQGEILHIKKIVEEGGAKESQWILERMYPDKWGARKPEGKQKETLNAIDAAFSETKRLNGPSRKNSKRK